MSNFMERAFESANPGTSLDRVVSPSLMRELTPFLGNTDSLNILRQMQAASSQLPSGFPSLDQLLDDNTQDSPLQVIESVFSGGPNNSLSTIESLIGSRNPLSGFESLLGANAQGNPLQAIESVIGGANRNNPLAGIESLLGENNPLSGIESLFGGANGGGLGGLLGAVGGGEGGIGGLLGSLTGILGEIAPLISQIAPILGQIVPLVAKIAPLALIAL